VIGVVATLVSQHADPSAASNPTFTDARSVGLTALDTPWPSLILPVFQREGASPVYVATSQRPLNCRDRPSSQMTEAVISI
jgi:hypothetical protein